MLLEGSQQITQITQIIFLPTEIIFANGEHEEHEVFLVNRFFIANGEHEEHEVLFGQHITQITQKINFVIFVLSVGKRKNNLCNLCNLLTKKALLSSRTTEPGKSKICNFIINP